MNMNIYNINYDSRYIIGIYIDKIVSSIIVTI
nr:MAG TPA: hypothetical protein [Caudoviricetes sp.]